MAAYDAEEVGDTHLLAMEYLEGRTLAEEVRCRGRLPVAEACDAVRQAALDLQHAHERGLTHRDLKPHNLIRTPEGLVKVLDFALPAGKRHGAWPLPDGRLLVQVEDSLSRWDVGRGEKLADLGMLPGEPAWQRNVVDVSPDGRQLCVIFSGRDPLQVFGLSVLNLETGKEQFRVGPLDGRSTMSPSPRFSPDGRLLAVADRSPAGSALRLYDAANGQRIRTIDVRGRLGLSVAFGRGGKEVTADLVQDEADPFMNAGLVVWDVETGEQLRSSKLGQTWERPGRGAVVAGSGVYLTLQGRETVRVWDMDRGVLLETLRVPGLRVGAGGHSPDGRYLVLCGEERAYVIRLTAGGDRL